MVQAPFAWESAHDARGTIVAVLDSGVDLSHPDLSPNLLPIGCDVVTDHTCPSDGRGTPPQDRDGHGSAVAGVLAASGNDGLGITGIAWKASILPVRVTSGGSDTTLPIGTEADLITGLRWAVDQGAKVVNLSFAESCGQAESAVLKSAVQYAWDHGALLVAAAGNDATCPQGVFPAADPHVLAVTSTDRNDRPTATAPFGPWVGVAAPGDRILSTTTHGQYAYLSGTSLAAPLVSGLAALLFGAPGATNDAVRSWIRATCDVPDGWNPAYGCGRLNAYRAVSLAFGRQDPLGSPPPTVGVHLTAGWNNLFFLGRSRSPEVALAALRGTLTSVYAWDPVRGTWSAYLPSQAAASDLQLVVDRSAYWLYLSAAVDFTMSPTGVSPPSRISLSAGWNNVGLRSGSPSALVAMVTPSANSIFRWEPASALWRGYFAGAPQASDLNAGTGVAAYWVYVDEGAVLTSSP
jgi:subtilisin family serine protease